MGTAAAVVGGSLVSSYMGGKSAKKAAATSASAQRYSADLAQGQYDQTRKDFLPYRQAGRNALQELAGYGESRVAFDPNNIQLDPGYQFRKAEQERAINRQSAGLGKYLSGNRLEEIINRSGQLASQEYGAAYNRALTNYGVQQGVEADYLNRLQNLATIGQSSAAQTAAAGLANIGSQTQAATSAANTQAAAQLAQGQMYQNTLGNLSMFAGMGGFSPQVKQYYYSGS